MWIKKVLLQVINIGYEGMQGVVDNREKGPGGGGGGPNVL
jgi:hypothetical protein